QKGASLRDVNGHLQSGSMMAPPEGDAGTGMVSTNSVRQHTGNVSVGTSAFSMVVLDKPLKKIYRDIDIVTTPNNEDVAMVHINIVLRTLMPGLESFVNLPSALDWT